MKTITNHLFAAGLLMVATLSPSSAYSHLMVAQHGTLNFLDDNVYMVLSVPSSAFGDADENKDGLLSILEFSEHRESIIDLVAEHVSLGGKKNNFVLHDLRVSPVTPHDSPKDPAEQIIVLGRFSLASDVSEMYFHMDLFGKQSEQQSLEITAKRKSTNDEHAFIVSSVESTVQLNFKNRTNKMEILTGH